MAWGVFFGIPALGFDIGEALLSVSNIIILLILLVKFIKNILRGKPICFNPEFRYWYLFLGLFLATTAVASVTLPSDWFSKSLMRASRMIVLIAGMTLVFTRTELSLYKNKFFRGLFYSAVVNLIWGVLQMYCGYGMGININDVLFSEILHLDGGKNWTQNSGSLGLFYRMSGFSHEPAHFGMMANAGFILASSVWMRLAFALAILASTSKTGIICLAVTASVMLLKHLLARHVLRISLSKFITSMLLFSVAMIFCLLNTELVEQYIESVAGMFDLIHKIIFLDESNLSGDIHKAYYMYLFDIITGGSVANLLFGYGMLAAGFPYATNSIVNFAGVWNPESDVIMLFVGNGVIGALTYYTICLKGYLQAAEPRMRYLILLIVVAGIFYGNFIGWIMPLLLATIPKPEAQHD